MKETKTVQEIRRIQLKVFIDKKFDSIAEFASKLEINRNNVSTLLNGKRPFSDATANKIENTFALPHGYLSSEGDKERIVTDFIDVSFYEDMKNILDPNAKKQIRIASPFLEQINIQSLDSLIATRMNDELMYPTINKGELIIIDTSQNIVEEYKLHLFKVNGFLQVRRPVSAGKDMIALHIDNENEKKKYIINDVPLSEINNIGRIVGGIKNYN